MTDLIITPPEQIILEIPYSDLTEEDIPSLDASIITSGTFEDARIPASIARDSEVASTYQPKITSANAAATRGLLELDSYPAMVGAIKPATRRDGSPIQVGDRWIDSTDRIWWYWNGFYWLSEDIYAFRIGSFVSATANIAPGITSAYNLFFLSMEAAIVFAVGAHDVANNYSIRLRRLAGNSSATAIEASLTTTALVTANTRPVYRLDLNFHRDAAALASAAFDLEFLKNGAAANCTIYASVYYRLAKP